jgi:choline dehydrogenase-like flavoprotein
MFLSWRSDLDYNDYRFVIVGSGPAGLYLAQSLATKGKVLIIEAGNADDTASVGDDFYRVIATGRDYVATGSRLMAFGGTSNHWGGHSLPLSREAFGARPHIAAWPIDYEDYVPHLERAGRFLNLRAFNAAAGPVSIETGILAGHQDLIATGFQYSDPTVRLGDTQYVEQMRVRTDIDVLVDTRVTDIDLATGEARVNAISIMHRPSRETKTVVAPQLFLCAGGIENARVLLWSGRKYAKGNPLLGGPNQLTGTHFTEKPYIWPIELFLDARADVTDAIATRDHPADACWELSEDFRKRHDLPRFGVFPGPGQPIPTDDPALESVSAIYAHASPSYVRFDPAFQFEQTPYDGSYVRLSGELDADGIALPELNWGISAADLDGYRRATLLFCGLLSQRGVARCRIRTEYQAEDWAEAFIGTSNHHIGTTRMGTSPLEGVVDRNCRVFGVDNLFVAGSSVFPSGDYINPTLTLVALAGRLADHVIRELG